MGYLFQGVMIFLWWIGILFSPNFYAYFEFSEISHTTFVYFALPDICIISVLSFIHFWKPSLVLRAIILGGFSYAALFCLMATMMSQTGYLSTIMMMLGVMFNVHLTFQEKLVYRKTRVSFGAILFKALLQSVVAWSLTLLVIPYYILKVAGKPIDPWQGAAIQYVAIFVFCCFGGLGLFCSYIMAKKGKGTPLPLDAANELVTSGPYGYIRNPMAIAGLGQGFAVALYLGSWEVAAYVFLGLVVWNYFVRPVEEKELQLFFGEQFDSYRSSVKCWVPNFKTYRGRSTLEESKPPKG